MQMFVLTREVQSMQWPWWQIKMGRQLSCCGFNLRRLHISPLSYVGGLIDHVWLTVTLGSQIGQFVPSKVGSKLGIYVQLLDDFIYTQFGGLAVKVLTCCTGVLDFESKIFQKPAEYLIVFIDFTCQANITLSYKPIDEIAMHFV